VAQSHLQFQPTRYQRISRWGVILVLLGTVALELVVPFFAWQWTRLPFPGVLFEHTLVVSGVYSDSWDVEFPKNPSARLVGINGGSVSNSRDMGQVWQTMSAGQAADLVFEPRNGSPLVTVQTILRDFRLQAWIAQFWLPYLVGLVYLGIGVWVFRYRGYERPGQSFALFCAFVALVTGTLFDLNTTHIFTRIWTAAMPLAAAALVHLGMVFPEEGSLTRRWPALRFFPYPIAIVLTLIAQIYLYDANDPWAYITYWRWIYAFLALALLTIFALMFYARARTVSGIVRQQVRIILVGSLLAFLPIVVYMILAGLAFRVTFYTTLYLPPLVIFPLFIAYAILRYKLLGMDLVISRGLAYTILVAAVAGAYILVLTVVGRTAGINLAGSSPLLLALFVVILILVFNPLREAAERLADRLLGRQRVDYRSALQDYSHELVATPLELPAILKRLLAQIEPVSHSAPAVVFLYDRRHGLYTPHQFSGFVEPESGTLGFDPDSNLVGWLSDLAEPVYLLDPATPQRSPRLTAPERQTLEALGLVLFLPLRGQRKLSGWVALGPRLSGEPYSPDDLNFLAALVDQTAIAIENAQLLTDLEKQVIRLDALREIGEAVDLRQDPEDLLSLIYEQTHRVIGADNFYVALYDQTRQEFRMAYYVEEGDRQAPPNPTWLLGTFLTSEIVRQRRFLVTDDYLAERERRGIPDSGRQAKAWLGVPLISGPGGRVLGVLNVSSFQPGHRYTQEQVQLMGTIADQAAVAIDRMRLYQEMEVRATELATLYEVSRTINSTLDLSAVLDLIMNKVVEILDVQAGSLLLLDDETGDLVFQVALGTSDSQRLIGRSHSVNTGIRGHVVQRGKAQIVNDVQSDSRWDNEVDRDTEFVTRSVLCVPLISRDRVIGVIEVINRRDPETPARTGRSARSRRGHLLGPGLGSCAQPHRRTNGPGGRRHQRLYLRVRGRDDDVHRHGRIYRSPSLS